MRLSTVIIFLTIVQVSASTYGQKVTYLKKEITLVKLFKEIKKQTGYNVVWYEENLDATRLVGAKFKDAPVEDVMNKALTGLHLSYTISKNTVVIKEKERSLLDKIADAIHSLVKDIHVRGSVTDEYNKPISGATVKIKGTNRSAITDGDGKFYLDNVKEKAVLIISYLGYKTMEIEASEQLPGIRLAESMSELAEVQVMSTGYQNIAKERATGSFVQIDNTLLNRSVSTNILDRLKGVTSGMLFSDNNARGPRQSTIEVRGRATLFSNAEPLIIVDNFPYDGDLGNINPSDIESITVLKDAAAASLWGARSGNGVIVLTTKKGALNTAPKISFNATLNISGKPDLYYQPQLSSAQYIEVENFLFNQGAYDSIIDNGYGALSPAVEIFLAKRKGLISASDSLAQINKLKNYDAREQILKYGYRESVNQQYQASIAGGGATQRYFVSAGYDKNLSNKFNSSYDRITLNASNTYYFLKNRLEFFSNITYTGSRTKVGGASAIARYPYTQVADAAGNPLAVAIDLRSSYTDTAGNGKLLNWIYKPLEEQNNGFNTAKNNLTDYRINLALNYHIFKGLKAAIFYNYGKGVTEGSLLNELDSYYTRNLINTYSQIDKTTGAVTYPLPLGSILNMSQNTTTAQNGRFQMDYANIWNKHTLNVIAGTEIRDNTSSSRSNSFYGYDIETETNLNSTINYAIDYPIFYNPYASGRVGDNSSQSGSTNRFLSLYFNGSYAYDNRYIATLSVRRDESNLFGVSTNQKGVPLWSTGLAWVLNNESFYNLNWLTSLKIRATYGYTGNVNNSLFASLTTAADINSFKYYKAYSELIVNPPNPSLRWEKIKNLDLGFDFITKNNRLSGSIDYWSKTGIDLIGNSPIAAQTGISMFTGNSANTLTRGVDVQLNSINFNDAFKWYTVFQYNYNRSKVTDYKVANGTNLDVVSANFNNPLKGYPYFAIFSFKYAGLDAKGNPQGYLNNEVSSDYGSIEGSQDRNELVYNGSSSPTSFGSLRNTFEYKNFEFSFNIIYKFGYYFRRSSLDNSGLYSSGISYQMADYAERWQKPGDELKTNVPSLIYPSNYSRDQLYQYSEVLVEKGDHIRLQDIRLSYNFHKRPSLPFNNLNLFIYANNIGILWKANKQNIDPDYPTGIPTPRSIALGLKVDF